MNRRSFFLGGACAFALAGVPKAFADSPFFQGQVPEGPFLPFWESLKAFHCPDWFRDAKFGIWAHWSPQCVPEQGDWYARNMYMQGSGQYEFHVKHYGHPSQFGYKDICHIWKAEKWDPEARFPDGLVADADSQWGRPILPIPACATAFEVRARELGLTADMYASSRELCAWGQEHRNRHYIPEWLLTEWCMTVEPDITNPG